MRERLLQYYETELEYLRRAFGDFEKLHPQKARVLGVQSGRIQDPDIQRLSDSLALVSARMQEQLDETLPEFALDLARMIAPGMLMGAPCYMPLTVAPGSDALAEPLTLPAHSEIEFSSEDRSDCKYVAVRDVPLQPIEISDVRVERAPLRFDAPETLRGLEAAIVITLSPADPEAAMAELLPGTLEFYVSASPARKRRLIDTFLGDVLSVGIAAPGQRRTIGLDKGCLGLAMLKSAHSTWLPSYLTQPPALERLRDFLAYPDKASFIHVDGLTGRLGQLPPGPVELRMFLDGRGAQQVAGVTADDLALNVVPAINCFTDQSRPIRYDFARGSVPVAAQTAEAMPVEVLRIEDVRRLLPEGEVVLEAITSPERRTISPNPIWQERPQVGNFDPSRRQISFSTPSDERSDLPEHIDFVSTLVCSNGTAALGPRPGDSGQFDADAAAEIPFEVLEEPSMPVPPDLSSDRLWDVMSLIQGNFATLFDDDDPVARLKEALHLCAPNGFSDAANAIWDIGLEQSIAPVSVGRNVLLAAGNKVEIVLDFDALPYSPRVFANVLNDYLSAFVSYDRFYQLTVRERGSRAAFIEFPKTHGSQLCG